MKKAVFFVRHGESLANIGVATTSPDSVALTPRGKEQAMAVAGYFSRQPDLIVHSKYSRTFETATPLINRFPDTAVEVWPIHEFTYLDTNIHTGTTPSDRKISVDRYWSKLDPNHIDGYGAESFSAMVSRVRECLGKIQVHSASKIVVFCHGQIMHILDIISRFPGARDVVIMEICREERLEGFSPKNTEVWEIRLSEDGKWSPFATRFVPRE